MSARLAVARLAARNTVRTWGRLVILTLLLSTAIVVQSSVSLVQGSLCREALSALHGDSLPRNLNAVVTFPHASYTPRGLNDRFKDLLGLSRKTYLGAIAAHSETYLGLSGEISVVAPYIGRRDDLRAFDVPAVWYTRLYGEYPGEYGEPAFPAPYARRHGLRVGDELVLLAPRQGGPPEPEVFTVTALHEPAGHGPFYRHFLTAGTTGECEPALNLLVVRLTNRQVSLLRSRGAGGGPAGGPDAGDAFGGFGEVLAEDSPQPGAAAAGIIVREFIEPAKSLSRLARSVYGSRSGAASFGSGLVGAAVLVVLLVAMVERRRESAVCKMVGMNALMTLGAFSLELIAGVVAALALAAPIYRLLATAYVLDVHSAAPGVLWPPFLMSALACTAMACLGALYPLVLTSVATPNQLLGGQKLFLFRRRQALRVWTDTV